MPAQSYSPAALKLMAVGVRATPIAEGLGTSTASVSRMLSGATPPPELFTVIAALGGRDLANEVRALIPSRAVSA
jgi:hypothetical protein